MDDVPRGTIACHQGKVSMERAGAKGALPFVSPPASAKRKLLACFLERNGTL
jgi:hypothetical protein